MLELFEGMSNRGHQYFQWCSPSYVFGSTSGDGAVCSARRLTKVCGGAGAEGGGASRTEVRRMRVV